MYKRNKIKLSVDLKPKRKHRFSTLRPMGIAKDYIFNGEVVTKVFNKDMQDHRTHCQCVEILEKDLAIFKNLLHDEKANRLNLLGEMEGKKCLKNL